MIEQLLIHINAHRKQPLVHNPLLANLAKNHSSRMALRQRTWVHDKSKRISGLIRDPREITIAWTLITLGFIIAWIFAIIGYVILKVGRQPYKKKHAEFVAQFPIRQKTHTISRVWESFRTQKGYAHVLADEDFKIIGIGIKVRKQQMYVTQIFYG